MCCQAIKLVGSKLQILQAAREAVADGDPGGEVEDRNILRLVRFIIGHFGKLNDYFSYLASRVMLDDSALSYAIFRALHMGVTYRLVLQCYRSVSTVKPCWEARS